MIYSPYACSLYVFVSMRGSGKWTVSCQLSVVSYVTELSFLLPKTMSC